MANLNLWDDLKRWKSECEFVELSHEFSPETPHWSGFPAMSYEKIFDYEVGFRVHKVTAVTQYGTHVDAPGHFVPGTRMLNELRADELVLPLVVIDVSAKVAEDCDYGVSVADIEDFEARYGRIPDGCFVAARTDWSKQEDMDNFDENGQKHYPGWGMDALKFLVEERNVAAIGHETSDTDVAVRSAAGGYVCEYYILEQDRYQIELLKNLDKVPPTGSVIVCGFPRGVDLTGFHARCYAICPKG